MLKRDCMVFDVLSYSIYYADISLIILLTNNCK
jgi:hypothetical protein